jgi:hypothetical protein
MPQNGRGPAAKDAIAPSSGAAIDLSISTGAEFESTADIEFLHLGVIVDSKRRDHIIALEYSV